MIKTPGSHADRIAQACDRCRSKKIRCDGKRPHCSQCLAVGFECKTSDKLSRRAFPRGYTESLEDRVRQLESENNKLMNLLDIKDEQMEMMSKVDSVTPQKKTKKGLKDSALTSSSSAVAVSSSTSSSSATNPSSTDAEDEEAYFVHQINTLSPEGSFHGSAAGGVFIDALLEKLKSKDCSMIPQLQQLFSTLNNPFVYDCQNSQKNHHSHYTSIKDLPTPISSASSPSSHSSFYQSIDMPSRLTADKLISTYFHEWNTMHAVLDQYEFLEQYQQLMNRFSAAEHSGNFQSMEGSELMVVMTIIVASLGSLALKDKSASAVAESWRLEKEWKRLFTNDLQTKPGLMTVQALVLAQLYSLHTGQMDDVWHYRMMTASMCQRLGLQRCHKSLKLANGESLTFYDQEMRRRVFWVAYTLDCFAAALLGAPRLLMEKDIECALPSNIDDDMLRGEIKAEDGDGSASTTQMTCPLTVIHFAQILGNILDTIYAPAPRSHPYKTVVRLEDKLEQWRRELPNSLKFEFSNGAPGPALAPLHQKSPLLLVLYHYARILIHMPAISAPSLGGSNTSTRGSASFVAVMQSAKVVLQVINYLKARLVIPCFAFNPARMSVFFSAVVLYGAVDYSRGGALLLDIRKVLASTVSHLCSDLQLHRPGSLNPDVCQVFEEACDSLLNTPAKKADAPRKRRASKKKEAEKEEAGETKIKQESSPSNSGSKYASKSVPKTSPSVKSAAGLTPIAPMPTPPPVESLQHNSSSNSNSKTLKKSCPTSTTTTERQPAIKTEWMPEADILRDSAINDLLMINLASSKSRSTSMCVNAKSNMSSPNDKKPRSSSDVCSNSTIKQQNKQQAQQQQQQAQQPLAPIVNPIDLFFESGMLSTGLDSKSASTVNLSQLTSFHDKSVSPRSARSSYSSSSPTSCCDSVETSISSLLDPINHHSPNSSSFSKNHLSLDSFSFGQNSSSGMNENGKSGSVSSASGINNNSNSSEHDSCSPSLSYSDDPISLLSDPAFASPDLLDFFSSSSTSTITKAGLRNGTQVVDLYGGNSHYSGFHTGVNGNTSVIGTTPSTAAGFHNEPEHSIGLKKDDAWDADLQMGLSGMNWNGFEV